MRPNRSTAASTAACALAGSVTSSATTSRSSCAPTAALTVSVRAAGRDDGVAGVQRGAGEVDAQAAARAGDEKDLLCRSCSVSPSCQVTRVAPRRLQSTERRSAAGEGEPVERGTGRDPHARRGAPTVVGMDQRQELRDFLLSRRARITPQQAGLPHFGASSRRVPGLRRSELALLANVSVEYLTKLERGNATGVSDTVLESVAQALQLDAGGDLAPVRPRPRRPDRVRHAPPAGAAAGPARRPAAARRDAGRPGVRAERPARPARRQRPRQGAVRRRLRAGSAHAGRRRHPERRPLHLPRRARRRALPRLGQGRRRHRRRPARRGRAQPDRPPVQRAARRAAARRPVQQRSGRRRTCAGTPAAPSASATASSASSR